MINDHTNEFYVTLMSNADTHSYDNKLSKFQNDLPNEFYLKPEDNWMVCVKSLGFSTSFFNMHRPIAPGDNLPSFIFYRVLNGKITDVDSTASVFFNKSRLTIDEISQSFEQVKQLLPEIQIKFNLSERPVISSKLSSDADDSQSILVLVHESARQTFDFPSSEFTEVLTAFNEPYHVFRISKSYHELKGASKDWYYKYPELVQIECEEVKERIYNSSFKKYLSVICPNFNPDDKYFTHSFDVEEYCELSNHFLSKLSVTLKDKNSELLNLLPGPASFLKLKFKKMPSEKFFNVRLSSESGEFETDLPQPLYLDSNWRVSLTSISYPSEIYSLPADENLRTMKGYINLGYNNAERKSPIPSSADATDKLVSVIDTFLSVKYNAERKSPVFETIPSSVDTTDKLVAVIDTFLSVNFKGSVRKHPRDGLLHFTIPSKVVVSIPTCVLELIGFRNSDFVKGMTIKGSSIQIENETAENLYFKLTGSSNTEGDNIRPEYMMVYCDTIRPCIVASEYLKLMCIVPIRYAKSNDGVGYVTEEFSQPERHEIESTRVKSIKMSLKTHWGSDITFAAGKKIFANLLFSRE